ncbi:FAD-dependent oxidoreductase [Alloacidobacterium dinghuense]|uniref:FAD-dependent oxidoreductase n=1 Tax=Alloacidobacterium dinghuense TaxID=2763107 RepID=A0A7G8BFM6_9BACT|nr:FAD-dependent oxidoreductase [Alloacidobacterium dinghuense]QNI31346.1 FAD-dependent oxidoreductase [Alloacidobacterium dinghuense]
MPERETTTCCIAGGGPAGVMLGYLLARAGVRVIVLEKHKDFFRDFRGDTIHPSTLELMRELGLLDEFLKLPHQRVPSIGGLFGDYAFTAADFSHLPVKCKFIALMPQWDFLNFLSEHGKRFSTFDLRTEHEAVGLLESEGVIKGVRVKTPQEEIEIAADLVVACDGRHSTVRDAAGFKVIDLGVPVDVLWFRISRKSEDSYQALGRIDYGSMLILINRGDYFQSGLIIRKGAFDSVKEAGIPAFHESLLRIAPFLGQRVKEISNWDQVKLLSVQINRLRKLYKPGLLCIGDAAHAMSPAGGVGINLAIQDAVATANILAEPLRAGRVTEDLLAKLQERREFPVRVIQAAQERAHNASLNFLGHPEKAHAPWQMRAFFKIPGIRRIIGLGIGLGVRPEHIHSPLEKSVIRDTM